MAALVLLGLSAASVVAASGPVPAAQEPSGPEAIAGPELQAAIDQLGVLDYETRTEASRTVRRAPPALAVPALLDAVSRHGDGYVRFRALVLLTGFSDPRTRAAMRDALASPNDRLRTVAYGYFEDRPDEAALSDLLAALETEFAEFVRPALVRALAAQDDRRVEAALVREAGRGEDFFRSAVIEALGDHEAGYAFDAVREIAEVEGPLQDDAALALGRMGDARAVPVLAELLRTAPEANRPIVAAALCLLGVDCESHEADVVATLSVASATPGEEARLRSASSALGALGVGGRITAVEALFRVGIPSRDPTRARVALALATIALRNTPLYLSALAPHPAREEAIALTAEGFDMLEEDLQKERFFALVRRRYWQAGPGTPDADLMQALVTRLDF